MLLYYQISGTNLKKATKQGERRESGINTRPLETQGCNSGLLNTGKVLTILSVDI